MQGTANTLAAKLGKSWNGARGKFFPRSLWPKLGQDDEEIGHQRLTQYQSPVIRTSTLDKCHRASKGKTQMMNWTKLHSRKNNQILKEGTPLFPSDIKGTERVITRLKCSSLPPFSVRVIKDMSGLGEESQPGYSLLTGDRETFGLNKDMILANKAVMIIRLLIIRHFCSCLFSYFVAYLPCITTEEQKTLASDWSFSLILILSAEHH